MPRFGEADALLADADVFRRLTSSLPDLLGIIQTRDPQAVDLARKAWGVTATSNFSVGVQREVGRMMVSCGLPDYLSVAAVEVLKIPPVALETGKLILDLLPGDLLTMLVDEVKELLVEVVTMVIGTIIDIFAAIPIVGWIIDMVWDLAMGIVSIVKLAQEQSKPPPEHEISPFQPHPETDTLRVNALLEISQTTDWTNIFMPPGIDRNTTWGDYYVSTKTTPGGRRVASRGMRTEWFGFMPDTTILHRELEVQAGGMHTIEIGSANPSTRQLAIAMWGQAQTNTPAGLTVDAAYAGKMWTAYLTNARGFLEHEDKSKMKRETRERLINQLDDEWGWGPVGDFQVRQAFPVKALRRLERNQKKFLNTYTGLYVDSSWGVFQHSVGENPRLDQMVRNQEYALTRDDVVCRAELGLVPYPLRGQIEFRRSQIGPGPCMSAGIGDAKYAPTPKTPRKAGRLAPQPTLEGTGDADLDVAPQLPLNLARRRRPGQRPSRGAVTGGQTAEQALGVEGEAETQKGVIETLVLVALMMMRL